MAHVRVTEGDLVSYLYGDSTPSPLASNFIEFLGDSLDFGVHLLLSGERMKRCGDRIAELKEVADAEVRLLEALGESVTRAALDAPQGSGGSATSNCAATIAQRVDELVQAKIDQVRGDLARNIAAVEADDALERGGCLGALENLLRGHDPPEATSAYHLIEDGGRYRATRTTRTPYGLEWSFDVNVPAPHPFAQATTLSSIVSPLEITAPLVTGWLRKQVRTLPQPFEMFYLTELSLPAHGAMIRLRSSLEEAAGGFDIVYDDDGVRLHRKGEKGTIGEVTEPSDADAAKLHGLLLKLRQVAAEMPRGKSRLKDAKLDDQEVADLREPQLLVHRLVATMTPIVSEIAHHSQSTTELVLKRLLGDNRREEIFVSKKVLTEKLSPLPEPLRAAFKSLGVTLTATRPPPLPTSMTAKATAPSRPPVEPPASASSILAAAAAPITPSPASVSGIVATIPTAPISASALPNSTSLSSRPVLELPLSDGTNDF